MSHAALTVSGSSCGLTRPIRMSGRVSRIRRAAVAEPWTAWPTQITRTPELAASPVSWAITVSCSSAKFLG